MDRRGYAVVDVKSVDDEQRLIAGIASTIEVDRAGDIVHAPGAKFADSIPLLLHHDARLPVGQAKLRKSDDGLNFTARLPKIDEPGTLKSRIDEAWQSIKAGLIKGVSIGFRAADDGFELLKSGGLKYTDFEVLELSLVAIPANQSASIHTVKQFDQSALAALGVRADSQHVQPAGVSATPVVKARPERTVKTITEQITGFEATRQAKNAEREGLMTAAADKGETLDAAAAEKYDTLATEIKAIDDHLVRLHEMETSNKAAAVEVKATTIADASASRQGVTRVSVQENTPKGIAMARVVISKMASYMEFRNGNYVSAAEIAKQRYPGDPRIHAYIQKTAVAGGITTDANWATELVEPVTMDFVEYLRHKTVLGKLSLQRRPFNIRTPRQTTAGAGYWVGEGKPKPLTKFHFDAVTLPYTKVASIAVITQELARFSNPSAEAIVRDQLAAACQERLDTDLLDPDKAVSVGVNPASLTNGVTALTSAGTAAANVITDVQNLVEQFILNRQDPSGLVLVMPNTLALAASLMITANGVNQFPGLTMNGGTLLGIPVVTSQYAASGASYGNMVIAIDQNAVALADDGGFTVDISTEASLQMDDAPSNDASDGTGQSLVSMFQTNSIAIRAEREIHWIKLRSTAVSFMDDVNWGSIGSPV